MIFSSISFLVLFLPLTVLLYYITPNLKIKNAILLIASLIFYGLGEPRYIFLLIFSTLINYLLTIKMTAAKKPKLFIGIAVVFNLGILAFFKYIFTSLPLPIGISFFTFQILSYCIDVYRDKTILQKNFFNLLLYISFFPQLIAGPIVKYYDVQNQIEFRSTTSKGVAEGLRRFIFGLTKKVVFSNTIGFVVDGIYALDIGSINSVIAWCAALLYCLQIYYDFSGYSDMALGLGKMFGFDFKENFLYPYSATSIKDFWRRWHISLSTWFKEYLYIPLGGNRRGKLRTYINKYIVFFLTGLWHGADITFVIWGLIHGTFSVLEEVKFFSKLISKKIIGWIYTIFVVSIAFVFFRSDTLQIAITFIGKMFTGFNFTRASFAEFLPFLDTFTIFIIIISVIGMFNLKEKFKPTLKNKYINGATYVASVLCLILCVMLLATNSYNPFIYFRF